jgi:hypothetical protein
MNITQKPVRVGEGTVTIALCPVCGQPIEGTVTAEVHLDPLSIVPGLQSDLDEVQSFSLRARVKATTRLRNLRVQHDCSPTDVSHHQRTDAVEEE